MKVKEEHGQSLVEVAVVLPLLMMGIFVTAQLAIFCHNRVCLQTMALQMATKKTSETPYARPVNTLWGNTTLSAPSPKTVSLPHPWRYFYSLTAVNNSPGHIYMARATSVLGPGPVLAGKIPNVTQLATAAAYVETPAPSQD